MFSRLPHDEIEMWHGHPDLCMDNLEDILYTKDDSFGYFYEVGLKYSDEIKQKTKNFPFGPEHKKTNPDDFTLHMIKIKPDKLTITKKLICNWTDKKNYLMQ